MTEHFGRWQRGPGGEPLPLPRLADVHVDYPHHPGHLYDCPACEASCHCTPGDAQCIWPGHGRGVHPTGVACPACSAPPGRPCTVPTDAGRRDVTWVHHARQDLAEGW